MNLKIEDYINSEHFIKQEEDGLYINVYLAALPMKDERYYVTLDNQKVPFPIYVKTFPKNLNYNKQ